MPRILTAYPHNSTPEGLETVLKEERRKEGRWVMLYSVCAERVGYTMNHFRDSLLRRERECVCVCVCVCEREREIERAREIEREPLVHTGLRYQSKLL